MEKDTKKVTKKDSASKSNKAKTTKPENKKTEENKSVKVTKTANSNKTKTATVVKKETSKPKTTNVSKNSKKTSAKTEKNKSKALIEPEKLEIEELETIKKEIKNTKIRRNSSEKKQKKFKEIFINLLIACFVVLYYLALIIGVQKVSIIQFITGIQIIIMIEAITTIILFETAYKKDETTFTLYGIEMLVLGITTIFLLDLVSKRNDMINIVIAIMELCFTLYYLVKILVLSLRKNKKSKK